jgi:hypothetical protein
MIVVAALGFAAGYFFGFLAGNDGRDLRRTR